MTSNLTITPETARAMAECAAQLLDHYRTRNCSCVHSITRIQLRDPAVRVLRWLWQTGDAAQRRLVANRVRVWTGAADWCALDAIFRRERARLESAGPKNLAKTSDPIWDSRNTTHPVGCD